ncbi:hypothetical protein [Flavimaricola marinus]|uniref:Uncharacterized protein n=1 Tax=Flavimaricola marinus TaxID=1819565 RepID=A0A238LL11_9RHOB|nr:hypothetical protein [Flavimaricola marinus]SMY10361.1 hypothetical protein LOM8899_04536 [Flavimaricola marinus]
MNRIWRFFGNTLIVSALMSRAAAAMGIVEPARIDDDIWRNLRKEIELERVPLALDADLGDALVSALEAGGDLHETILISYRILPENKWQSLDDFWQDQRVIQTSASGIQAFVDVRTSVSGSAGVTPDELYENWILRAHHKPGHYDNGGGND